MEEAPPPDLVSLLDAASDFASYPGMQNDESVKEFLDRFPLSLIFSILQDRADVPMLESLVSCLERIFKTKYGTGLIPQYINFVQVGLQSVSQLIRCLACKAVYFLLVNTDDVAREIQLIKENDVYPQLITCLHDGNEQVAAASTDAIISLAMSPEGLNVILPRNVNETTHLKRIATHCSSLARVRILALIAKLFSLSTFVASMVYESDLLSLYEEELKNTNDMLMSLNALELLYELAESPHSTRFLLKATLLELLSSLISNNNIESVLRSRALLLTGRILSAADTYSVIDESSVRFSILAIDKRLDLLKDHDTDECESALEALGNIGTSIEGATLLLMSPLSVARHVVASAFSQRGRGIVLAALHALGKIAGVDRFDDGLLIGSSAEQCLQQLIYMTAVNSTRLTPSGLFLSVLQQEPDVRLAAYRLLSVLVARKWCLVEICSKQDIINIVTDSHIETNKNGMDNRYHCCVAISKALSDFNLQNDPALTGTVEKVQEAIKRGPYLPKRKIEAQPLVITADRF